MTEKVKTVIEFYFLLPDFKSRGHPNSEAKHFQTVLFIINPPKISLTS